MMCADSPIPRDDVAADAEGGDGGPKDKAL